MALRRHPFCVILAKKLLHDCLDSSLLGTTKSKCLRSEISTFQFSAARGPFQKSQVETVLKSPLTCVLCLLIWNLGEYPCSRVVWIGHDAARQLEFPSSSKPECRRGRASCSFGAPHRSPAHPWAQPQTQRPLSPRRRRTPRPRRRRRSATATRISSNYCSWLAG